LKILQAKLLIFSFTGIMTAKLPSNLQTRNDSCSGFAIIQALPERSGTGCPGWHAFGKVVVARSAIVERQPI
jgi:hypothetical protein